MEFKDYVICRACLCHMTHSAAHDLDGTWGKFKALRSPAHGRLGCIRRRAWHQPEPGERKL